MIDEIVLWTTGPQWSRPVKGGTRQTINVTHTARDWPQWSRPVKGGTRMIAINAMIAKMMPQWSRPVKGGTSGAGVEAVPSGAGRNGAAR